MEPEAPDRDGRTDKAPQTGNVIRLVPRDWLGPTDELVPFGPSAEHAVAGEQVASVAEISAAQSFWSADAASLHEPVDPGVVPAPPASAGRPVLRALPWLRDPRVLAALAACAVVVLLAVLGEGGTGRGFSRASAKPRERAVHNPVTLLPKADAANRRAVTAGVIGAFTAAHHAAIVAEHRGHAVVQHSQARARALKSKRIAQLRSRRAAHRQPTSPPPAVTPQSSGSGSVSGSSVASGGSFTVVSSPPVVSAPTYSAPAPSGNAGSGSSASGSGCFPGDPGC